MTHLGSIEAVVAAIREDAAAEVERIERDGAAAAARLRAEDAALPVIVPDADARIGAARRMVRDRLGAEDVADHQAALSDREAWLQRVAAEGERRLAASDAAARRAELITLIREALDRMPTDRLELLVHPRDLDLVETMRRDGTMSARGGSLVRVKASPEVAAGCIVQTVDGRIRYENSYRIRARRFEAAWRAQLGELYEHRQDRPLAAAGSPRSDGA